MRNRRAKFAASAVFLLVFASMAVFVLRPYRRLASLAEQMIIRHAPPGTVVNGVTLSFPSRLSLINLSVPVRINDRQREIFFEKLSGSVSIPSLLKGNLDAQMNSDFFGGMLWLEVLTEPTRDSDEPRDAPIAFEARAREIDLLQLCEFLEAPVSVSGRCDADIEAELYEHDPTRLSGRALVIAEKIEMPPLHVEILLVPANRNATFNASLRADAGKIHIERFHFAGTAYELAGNGDVRLSEPFEQSPLDCAFSIMFSQPPTVTDPKLARMGADAVVETLVKSRTNLPFKLNGTFEKPEIALDPASSLGSIIQRFER